LDRAAASTVFADLVVDCVAVGATVPAVTAAFERKGLRVPTCHAEYLTAASALQGGAR